MDRSHVSHTIYKWQGHFGIGEWEIFTEKINPDAVSIDYNGHKYFVGILRDFDAKRAVIYHDIALDEESIIHELLHIIFPRPNPDETYLDYERWITDVAQNLNKNEPTTPRRNGTGEML